MPSDHFLVQTLQSALAVGLEHRFCLLYLNVGASSEPGLVSEHFVYVVELLEASWRALQALQPHRVSTHSQEHS